MSSHEELQRIAFVEFASAGYTGTSIQRIAELEVRGLSPDYRNKFVEEFVDFLFDCRQEVHMFINQGPSLQDVPVIKRANNTVRNLAEFFSSSTANPHDKMRFGIALGGSAYMLCTADNLNFSRLL